MALLMVVLMTASVAEFNFSSRAKILGSAHARDDARAYYLAKSGIRVYSLLLGWGRALTQNPILQQLMPMLGMGQDGGPGLICKSLPMFDTAILRFLVGVDGGHMNETEEGGLLALMGMGGEEASPAKPGEETPKPRGALDPDAPEQGLRRNILDFPGDFRVECRDNAAGIDLNGFSNLGWQALPLEQHPVALMLYGILAPGEYDALFEERLKMDRWELIANIKDYIDLDKERSGRWGGDEDSLYDDFEPRGRAKNAKLETVAEARMIAGVTDEVWETFSPDWSVSTQNYKVNVNTAPAHILKGLVRAFADPTVMEVDLDRKLQILTLERVIIPFANANDFIARLKSPTTRFPFPPEMLGGVVPVILLQPALEQSMKSLILTDSNQFRLTATGYLGESERTIEALVRAARNGRVTVLDWKER
jgi:general secretion pathway protein K